MPAELVSFSFTLHFFCHSMDRWLRDTLWLWFERTTELDGMSRYIRGKERRMVGLYKKIKNTVVVWYAMVLCPKNMIIQQHPAQIAMAIAWYQDTRNGKMSKKHKILWCMFKKIPKGIRMFFVNGILGMWISVLWYIHDSKYQSTSVTSLYKTSTFSTKITTNYFVF